MIISPDDRRFIVTALRIARDVYNADAKILRKHDGTSIRAIANEATQKAQRADELADSIEHDDRVCGFCGEPWPCSDVERNDILPLERAKHFVRPIA